MPSFETVRFLRRAAKTAGAWALHGAGLDRLAAWQSGRGAEPLVLCYHRVVERIEEHPSSAPAMLVSRATLERQLAWVDRRYRFVGLDELARAVEAGTAASAKRPLAAVTFDDGYADVFHVGFPLLRRMGIPPAVFVPTDFVGTDRLHAHDELYLALLASARRDGFYGLARRLVALGVPAESTLGLAGPRAAERLLLLKEEMLESWPRRAIERAIAALGDGVELPARERAALAPMTWAMLAELRAAGAVVGSHTRRHLILPNEAEDEVRAELVGSKRVLEAKLGGAVEHLAYPDGQFSRATIEAARAAGYRFAYTICDHRSAARPLLTQSRLTLWERSSAGLVGAFSPAVAACQVRGLFGRLRPCRRDHEKAPGRPLPSRAWGAPTPPADEVPMGLESSA